MTFRVKTIKRVEYKYDEENLYRAPQEIVRYQPLIKHLVDTDKPWVFQS